jgi:RimJ/RimL family protein N-acetyltransferase
MRLNGYAQYQNNEIRESTMTITLPADYRQANLNDAAAMAELVNMAGEGLPLYLWTTMAVEGQSPWDIGQDRAQRESGGFSYRNTIVREESNRIVASLVGYPLDDHPAPTDYANMPSLFVPLQQLEDMVPGTWYVNVLATYPESRGKGIGSELLSIAEGIATKLSKRALSIIVADTNTGARRLYERHGYSEVAQRAMVKDNWVHPGANWVLLLKDI